MTPRDVVPHSPLRKNPPERRCPIQAQLEWARALKFRFVKIRQNDGAPFKRSLSGREP
jgi:hypothetical protein